MEISIIGGGITGLTTALALHKNGITPIVYEQSENLNEIGAGIWLQPNAVQVFKWLGIEREVAENGHFLNKMEITYPDLKPIKQIKSAVVTDQYGNQTIAIHRGKLQRILYEKCKQHSLVKLDMPYIAHEIQDDRIRVHFQGSSLDTDVLLGADGIKSRVRDAMGLPAVHRRTGQICCRGIAPSTLPKKIRYEGKEMWGRKLRFGFSQLSEEEVYFFIVINKEICPEVIDKPSLCSLYKSFHPIVTDIITASGDTHIAELMDLKRLSTWHDGHVCLLGDAAHATTPNMGQGACQGIEDAYYVSQYLKDASSAPAAFQAFEDRRRKKVDYVVNNSWTFGKMAHHKTGQFLMIAMMKLTPEKVMRQQMNKLYALENI